MSTIQELLSANPKPEGIVLSYGTAGFRTIASRLPSTCLRMGCLAVLRARTFEEKAVGIMITASHNKECDNGLKLVDPDGSMLATEWEPFCTELANADDPYSVLKSLESKFNLVDSKKNVTLYIARDTRPSSPELCDLVVVGARAMGATVVELGVITTPQLHFCVRNHNLGLSPTVDCYYKTVLDAFRVIIEEDLKERKMVPSVVDCANGVGKYPIQYVKDTLSDIVDWDIRNIDDKGLNENVGADHTHRIRKLPNNISSITDKKKKCISIDGDADRVVYFTINDDETMTLIDGDKITCLFADYINEIMKKAGIELSVGVVQTAYANGASTSYMKDTLNMKMSISKTGVKHLHHEAISYDIGIYFEANGHGTILFSDNYYTAVDNAIQNNNDNNINRSLTILKSLPLLVNQAIGDALSDLLLVEAILLYKNWTVTDWIGLYVDYPSRMLQTKVRDRTIVKTTNAERTCISPEGLQQAIDNAVGDGPCRRSFVRASGTEDIVRVYAEAATQEEADELANQISELVRQYCS